MNKFLASFLALLATFSLFGVDTLAQDTSADQQKPIVLQKQLQAQLIDPGDNPSGVGGSTSWGGSLRQAILTIINFFLFFLGLVATGFVIYGGFLYVTSQGEQEKVETGKKIIMYAAIGIIIILVSFALVNTLIGAGTGGRT